jgi:hypothetical protein
MEKACGKVAGSRRFVRTARKTAEDDHDDEDEED